MFPYRPTKKKIKIMTPRGEADSIRIAMHSGVMYFCKTNTNGIEENFILADCEIIFEECVEE